MKRLHGIRAAAAILLGAAFWQIAAPVAAQVEDVAPARQLTLESVEIQGNSRTRDNIILAHLGLQTGDVVDVDIFEAARLRLINTDYFRDVNFSTKRGSERGRVVLVIEVEERRASFETGFGYDDLDGWFLTLLGLRVDNSLGTESRFRLGWRLGFRVNGLDAEWDQTLKPGGRTGLNIRGYLFNRRHLFFGSGPQSNWMGSGWTGFEQDITNVGIEGSLRYDVRDRTRISFGLKTRYVEPDSSFQTTGDNDEDISGSQLPPELQAQVDENVISGAFFRGIRNTRDSRNYPTRGSLAVLKFELNHSQLEDNVYTKTSLDVRKHFSLGEQKVFSTRASGGYISPGAPYYERFYIGGNYSIRGFEEWSLSATDGDDAYWLVNAELRVPLTAVRGEQPRLTGLLFLDAGQGWSRGVDTVGGINVGTGYGVRLRLPWLGTLGIDCGIPLTDAPTGDPFWVHVLLGFSF